MSKLYRVSEAAKMFHITRTALIHYDNCGLLSPSVRNEKNYRFYTQDDIKKLELILALKESGLSLKDIKSYTDKRSKKTGLEMLMSQKEELDKKILSLKTQRQVIEKKIAHLKRFRSVDIYEGIILEEYPQISIIMEPIGFGPLMNYSSAVNRLKKRLPEESQLTSKYGVCFHIHNKDSSGRYEKKYVFDYLSEQKDIKDISHIPKSGYLCSIHMGNISSAGDTIDTILDYAHKKGYDLEGTAYYIPLFDYWESMSDEFIGEIMVPVKRK